MLLSDQITTNKKEISLSELPLFFWLGSFGVKIGTIFLTNNFRVNLLTLMRLYMNLFVRHAFCFCKTGDDKKGFQSPLPPPTTKGKKGPKKKRRKTESETWVPPPPTEHKDCSLQAIFVVIRPKSTFCQALHCLACKSIIPLLQKT